LAPHPRKPSGEAYFAAFELPQDVVSSVRNVEVKGEMFIICPTTKETTHRV
jgi:hypothetical protein